MDDIQKLADKLLKFTNAKSVFLYGSRARKDFYDDSDYEIGVLIERDKYVSRSDIRKQFNFTGVNIFPFYYEDFIAGNLDTPFVKTIYMKEIIEAGKTLAGEKIIENLKSPPIYLIDIIQDLRFNLGYSLAATHSYRNGDNVTAALHLAKSCLFGTRDYIIFQRKEFPTSYDDIISASDKLDLQQYSKLPIYAYKLRNRKIEINEQYFFENISYLNQFIEKQLLKAYAKQGNIILVE